MTTRQHAICRIEKIYHSGETSINLLRGGAAQKAKEIAFAESLNETFDISHANAEKLIANVEDKAFLKKQLSSGRNSSSMA